jgi:hypothetical protein
VAHVLGRAQLGAKAPQRRGRDGRGKVCRQLTPGSGLHVFEHVGGAPPGEIARDNVRRQRKAGANEFLRNNRGCQRLAVDQHAITIEDDHGFPDPSAGHFRPARDATLRTNHAWEQ